MIEESKKKIEYIDVARGIAIILMLLGHSITPKTIAYNIIYSFHMPLFIFISGMFFKERDFKSFIVNITQKLLLPYMIVVLIADICKGETLVNYIYQIVHSSGETLGVLWFMPFLAIIKFIFYMLKKISKNNDMLLYILCFLCTIFSYVLSQYKKYEVLWDVSLFSMLYYFLGYFVMKYELVEKILDNKKIMLILLFIWILGANVYRDLIKREYADCYLTIIVAISAIFVVLKLSKIILQKFNSLANVLMWYGKNTLYVLLFHYTEWELIPYDRIFEYSLWTDRMVMLTIKIIIVTVGVFVKDLIFAIYNKLRNKKRMYK